MGKYIIDIDESFISSEDEVMLYKQDFFKRFPVEPYNECSGKECHSRIWPNTLKLKQGSLMS